MIMSRFLRNSYIIQNISLYGVLFNAAQDGNETSSNEAVPAFRLHSVERELLAAKEEISELVEKLEQKRKELRESLRREALLMEELRASQDGIKALQREVI